MEKLVLMEDALGLIKTGDTLALGGVLLYRRPMAFVLNLIETDVDALTLFSLTSGIESDILIAKKKVKKVRTSYFGMDFLGFAPAFKEAFEKNRIEFLEETELTVCLSLLANLLDVPFLPTERFFETDILKVRKDLKVFNCPLTQKKLVAVPKIDIDVAVIHVEACDEEGNAKISGNYGIDRELARASRTVILTCERIEEVENVQILGSDVTCVVKVENGAYPTSCYPTPFDIKMLFKYIVSYPNLQSYVDLVREKYGY